jgi:hypothetical protein
MFLNRSCHPVAHALLVRCYRSAALEEQARASLRDPVPPHLNTPNNFRYKRSKRNLGTTLIG